jgi:hypothetical protein
MSVKQGSTNLLVHFTFNRVYLMVLIISLYGFNFVPMGTYLPLPVSGQYSFDQDIRYAIPGTNLEVNYPSTWEEKPEFGISDTNTFRYITSIDTLDGAVLRLFLSDTFMEPSAYNNWYYDSMKETSQISYSNPITLGGILPGGIMSYTSPCKDCQPYQDLLSLESWGRLTDDTGYVHFAFVANDPDRFRTYGVTASTIAGSVHEVDSGGTGGFGGGGTGGFGGGGTGGFGSGPEG